MNLVIWLLYNQFLYCITIIALFKDLEIDSELDSIFEEESSLDRVAGQQELMVSDRWSWGKVKKKIRKAVRKALRKQERKLQKGFRRSMSR